VRELEGDSIVLRQSFPVRPAARRSAQSNYADEATSVSRQSRLTELIQQAHGAIGVRQAADFLRDRNLSGGVLCRQRSRAALTRSSPRTPCD